MYDSTEIEGVSYVITNSEGQSALVGKRKDGSYVVLPVSDPAFFIPDAFVSTINEQDLDSEEISRVKQNLDLEDPFFDYFGPLLWGGDDFRRPDVARFAQGEEGLFLKSGHPVTAFGALAQNSIAAIQDNHLYWPGYDAEPTPGNPIRILAVQLNREPALVGFRVKFSPETTPNVAPEEMVDGVRIGGNGANVCAGLFNTPAGFAGGSLQWTMCRTGLWVFVVENPIVEPYPIYLTVHFNREAADDDKTYYSVFAHWERSTSTLTVWVPGLMDEPVSVSDPIFGQYAGTGLGFQERRRVGTDSRIKWSHVGFGGPTPIESNLITTGINLPRAKDTYIKSIPPEGYRITDPMIELWGRPTGGWHPAFDMASASIWKTTPGHKSFAGFVGANGKLGAWLSTDGVTQLGPFYCNVVIPANATGVMEWYDHVTGYLHFYYTTDPVLDDAPDWLEMGTAGGLQVIAGGGLLFDAPRETTIMYGTRDNSAALMWGGLLTRVRWTDGGDLIGDCDFRKVWLSSRRMDSAGNIFYIQGPGWSWGSVSGGLTDALFNSVGDLIVGAGVGSSQVLALGPVGHHLESTPLGLAYVAPPDTTMYEMPILQAAINAVADTNFWVPVNIPAANLIIGALYQLVFEAKISAPNGYAFSNSVRMKVGGVTIATIISTSQPTTAVITDKIVSATAELWVDQIGAGGLLSVSCRSDGLNAAGASSRTLTSVEQAARDLSAGMQLAFSINLAGAGCSFTPLRGYLKRIA